MLHLVAFWCLEIPFLVEVLWLTQFISLCDLLAVVPLLRYHGSHEMKISFCNYKSFLKRGGIYRRIYACQNQTLKRKLKRQLELWDSKLIFAC